MEKFLNLVIADCSDPKERPSVIVETFHIRDDVKDPEQALRDAIKEFLGSETEDSKNALEYANGYYNWGDVIVTVSSALFEKHGLKPLGQDAVDICVDHNETLT